MTEIEGLAGRIWVIGDHGENPDAVSAHSVVYLDVGATVQRCNGATVRHGGTNGVAFSDDAIQHRYRHPHVDPHGVEGSDGL